MTRLLVSFFQTLNECTFFKKDSKVDDICFILNFTKLKNLKNQIYLVLYDRIVQ